MTELLPRREMIDVLDALNSVYNNGISSCGLANMHNATETS